MWNKLASLEGGPFALSNFMVWRFWPNLSLPTPLLLSDASVKSFHEADSGLASLSLHSRRRVWVASTGLEGALPLSLRSGLWPVVTVFPGALLLRTGGQTEGHIMAFLNVLSSTSRISQRLEIDGTLWRKWVVFPVKGSAARTGSKCSGEVEKHPREAIRCHPPQRLIHAERPQNILFCHVSLYHVTNWRMSNYSLIKSKRKAPLI